MKYKHLLWKTALLLSLLPTIAFAQVTQADYERAAGLRNKFQGLAVNIVERPTWIGKTSRFWYRRSEERRVGTDCSVGWPPRPSSAAESSAYSLTEAMSICSR